MSQISLKKNSTDAIRALATLVVIFAHLDNTMTTRPENPLLIAATFGNTAVGLFFFYTGYNMLHGYIHREAWSRDYWLKKLARIYLPFVLVNIVGRITWLAQGATTDILSIVTCLVGINLLSPELWYIQSCMLIYLLFYIVFIVYDKVKGDRPARRLLVTCFCVLIWVVYGIIFSRYGAYPEKSSYRPWPMLFGMIVGIYAPEIIKWWTKYKWEIFFTAAFVGVAIPKYAQYGMDIGLPLVGKLDFSQLRIFVVTVLANSLIINEEINSKPLSFIGKYSLYIYLTHVIFYKFYRSLLVFIRSDLLYMCVFLISTFAAAIALYHLAQYFERTLKKLKGRFMVKA